MPRWPSDPRERFDSNVDRSAGADACWPWLASRNRAGYGLFSVGKRATRDRSNAHRVAWVFANGPIPVGMWVLHKCDNPPCVNPAHLFLGTHEDNYADRHAKGRDSKGPSHGLAVARGTRRGAAHPHFGDRELPKRLNAVLAANPELRAHGDQHWSRRNPTLVKRGCAHYKTKVGPVEVEKIHALYTQLKSINKVAPLVGLSRSYVARILKGEHWTCKAQGTK